MKSDRDFLATAIKLAQQSAQIVLDLLKNPIVKSQKEDHSWVTEADLRSDRILRDGLAKAFPDHAILTEESGLSGRSGSDWIWLIDPLDGTKAYAKGIPGFSVMAGLLKEGAPYLGVVIDPLEGLLYEAIRGGGAFLTKEGKKSRLRVSDRKNFDEMPLVTSTGFPKEKLDQILAKLKTPVCHPINSVGIKVGMVVRQEADIYVNHHSVHYWDTCAPEVILEEAGGCFTRLDGGRLAYPMAGTYSHESFTLASNGRRHGELIDSLEGLLSL